MHIKHRTIFFRPRNIKNEVGPSTFEQELMMLDEADADHESVLVDERDIVTLDIKDPFPQNWSRPPFPPVDVANDKIVFQQIDVDFYKV